MARNGSDVAFALRCASTYVSWASMKTRCKSVGCRQWKDYGGRGIKVCDRWMKFENFLRDMGVKPDGTSLERIDNNGDYEPSNCRWATRKEQALNRRPTRRLIIEGREYFACELSKQSGLKTDTILGRHSRGLSLREILSPDRRIFKHGLSLGGKASGAAKQSMTHCKNGHEFTEANTRITKEGWRRCRRCCADRQSRYNQQLISLGM